MMSEKSQGRISKKIFRLRVALLQFGTKGAFHLSELAGRSGVFECEMDLFHEIFPQIHHNNV